MFISAIILAAGSGTRMNMGDKLFLSLSGKTPLNMCVDVFMEYGADELIICCNSENIERCMQDFERHQNIKIVLGGDTRQQSAYNGLCALDDKCGIVMLHDGARCLVTADIIDSCVKSADNFGSGIATVPVKDTIKRKTDITTTLKREELYAVQTPQAFRKELILKAYAKAVEEGYTGTDDSSLVERTGESVALVNGSYENIKLTTYSDYLQAEGIIISRMEQYGNISHAASSAGIAGVGSGYDVHRLEEGRALILGGLEIPFEKGLLGHSDADVLVHAVMDAILGAAGERDIGFHFSDKDPKYSGISSMLLLKEVDRIITGKGFEVVSIDACVIAQKPKLMPYVPIMQENISAALTGRPRVNIKATTTEGLGFCGRGEGIAANAVVCLKKTDK